MPIALRYYSIIFFLLMGSFSHLYGKVEYKYSYLPKKVYENQVFPITILEIGSQFSKNPKFIFDKKIAQKPISSKPLIVKNGNETFYTFYFKSINSNVTIPALRIENITGTNSLPKHIIPIAKLKPRDDFCGVLAADMKIKTSQASTYDASNNLITLLVDAYEANIENMHLRNVIESGIEQVHRVNAKVDAEFYMVVPSSQKKVKFTYFNTIKQQYIFLETDIDIKDSTVSTQSQLNPKDDSFDKLKKYSFISFALFFLLLFLWKKDFFYLMLMVVSLVILFIFYMPREKICVDQGSSLYILPTNTSRVCVVTDRQLTTDLLGKRANFNKIEYSNQMIGWIKDENICKD